MNFRTFKSGQPGREMFRGLGIADLLAAAESWDGLRSLVVAFNDQDKGHFVDAVRRRDGTASSGERVLLHAICFACDFAWLADELSNGKAWQRMDSPSGAWRQAVAACIAAVDD